ncbi:substrate-binding and VWA domain-containing protein [Nocardiopsis ansamitocini]|uniref:VWFA domain-containing protein n=1 Tax=Nocardiopsis ansamitocini TaxID=1670832 RepID=A0A9W6UGM6_9ACTN|nr:substrate-binding and VWA domain-containing protein [Nocardiopsis ansamitocini]GLU47776.1 hypothetical protein Nans01_21270 [Nocardiopsis ansamitocini]
MGRHRENGDDDAYDPRPRSSRKRRNRGRGRAFVALAGAVAILLGLGVTGWFVFGGQDGCRGQELPVGVAASPEIAPVLTELAGTFNGEKRVVDGRCVRVDVRGIDSANVAYGITGAGPTIGDTDSDVWIPDSNLWPRIAKRDAGSTTLTDTGTSVARSPLVLTMPAEAAADAEEAGEAFSWQTLVPTAAPGSGKTPAYRVRLVDPGRSASGLATLALISDAIGSDEASKPKLIAALQNLQQTVSIDEESAFNTLSDSEEEGPDPVLVLSEQAAWRYNVEHADAPVRVNYPESGTYVLDYPYVVRSGDALTLRAIELFRESLVTDEAHAAIRAEGFRSPDGGADSGTLHPDAGFQAEAPDSLPAPSDTALGSLTSSWNQLKLSTRLLTLVDVSGSMAEPVPGTGLNRMEVTTKAAAQGLSLFQPDSEIGVWEFSVRINNDLDYRETVPIRPLSAEVGEQTQKEALAKALDRITPEPDGDTGLYDSILAAHREMSRTYKPDRVNTILVLSDGNNDDDNSISLNELLSTLEAEFMEDRPVAVVSISFGPGLDPKPLQKIAAATNGAAYFTNDPTEIGDIFLQSFALRIGGEETP